MTTAVLTWLRHDVSSQANGASYGASNALNNIKHLINVLIQYGALPASRWVVASSDLVGANPYVVMKPRAGGPGRIWFQYLSTIAGLNANVNGADSTGIVSIGSYYGYWKDATTDTPANLFGAGMIFTPNTNKTGLCSGMFSTQADKYLVYDTEESLYLVNCNITPSAGYYYLLGNIFEDRAGNAGGGVIGTTSPPTTSGRGSLANAATFNPTATSNVIDEKGYSLGTLMSIPVSIGDYYLRDLTNSHISYLPVYFTGFRYAFGEVVKWKFRQMAWGPNSLAGDETKYESSPGGPVVSARHGTFYGATSSGGPWLTNFKV